MTIREFWHDIRERFRDDDHRDDWRSHERSSARDNERNPYARDYDRAGAERHYTARGFTPMGVHGLDYYRDDRFGAEANRGNNESQSQRQRFSSGRDDFDERAQFGASNRNDQYSESRWDVYSNELGSRNNWPDRYASASALRNHRGRGPSNWQRSDQRLYEEVCECLTDDEHIDASDIEVRVEQGVVTLSGTVPRRQDKRHAEELIEQIRGVQDVHNQLRVQRTDESGLSGH